MEATAQGRSGACPAAASFFAAGAQQVATNGTKAETLLLTLCVLSLGYARSSFSSVGESCILYPNVKPL